MELHPLQNTWNLWFHKSSDNNWSFESYQKLASFNNLEDYAIVSNHWTRYTWKMPCYS